jgi:acyl carrier protein
MEFEKIQRIIAQALNIDPSEVTMEKTFEDDLGADSLDRVEIVMMIEEELGIDIPDEAAEKIITVGDAVMAIRRIAGT